jgi:hypothetical protein
MPEEGELEEGEVIEEGEISVPPPKPEPKAVSKPAPAGASVCSLFSMHVCIAYSL